MHSYTYSPTYTGMSAHVREHIGITNAGEIFVLSDVYYHISPIVHQPDRQTDRHACMHAYIHTYTHKYIQALNRKLIM